MKFCVFFLKKWDCWHSVHLTLSFEKPGFKSTNPFTVVWLSFSSVMVCCFFVREVYLDSSKYSIRTEVNLSDLCCCHWQFVAEKQLHLLAAGPDVKGILNTNLENDWDYLNVDPNSPMRTLHLQNKKTCFHSNLTPDTVIMNSLALMLSYNHLHTVIQHKHP